MTPSELAKVREALCFPAHSDECSISSPADAHLSGCEPQPCDCGADEKCAMAHEALAILDREAGRKTRTVYAIEWNHIGKWQRDGATHAHIDDAISRVNTLGGPTVARILEVTESWEEPKP